VRMKTNTATKSGRTLHSYLCEAFAVEHLDDTRYAPVGAHAPTNTGRWVELLSVRSPAGEIVRFGTDLAAATAYAVSIGEDVMGESLAV